MDSRLKLEVKIKGHGEIERAHEFLLLIKAQGVINDYFLEAHGHYYSLYLYYENGIEDFITLTNGDVLEVKEGKLRNKKEHEAIVEWLNKNAEVQG